MCSTVSWRGNLSSATRHLFDVGLKMRSPLKYKDPEKHLSWDFLLLEEVFFSGTGKRRGLDAEGTQTNLFGET